MLFALFQWLLDNLILSWIPTYSNYPFPPEMENAMEEVFIFIRLFVELPVVNILADVFFTFTLVVGIGLVTVHGILMIASWILPTNIHKNDL